MGVMHLHATEPQGCWQMPEVKEGFSLPGFRGSTVLQHLDIRPLASRTVRLFLLF